MLVKKFDDSRESLLGPCFTILMRANALFIGSIGIEMILTGLEGARAIRRPRFMILLSFAFFLLGFVVIGLLSALRREQTGVDYLLATQRQALMVGLSAIATNNSGTCSSA